LSAMKVEQYLQDVFGLSPEDKLIEEFACWFDSSLLQPAHLYVTEKHLCYHIHGKKEERVIPWDHICDLKKKKTAKVIPNAILVLTTDHTELFFSFINRHHCYKLLHRKWKGQDHNDECVHESSHDHSGDSSLGGSEVSSPSFAPNIPEIEEGEAEAVPTTTTIPIEDVYEFKKELGTGAFSVVKLAVHRTSKISRAVKVIDKSAIKEKKEMLEREVDILKRIQHPNIVSVVEIFETPRYLYLVMELATGGELFDSIVSRGKYSEKDAAKLVRQIAHACAYLHKRGIVHRDLKPENLLLASKTPGADVKIADFGLSKIMQATSVLQTACGTPGYVAPEVLQGQGYNQEVDVWSIGVIMYILLCGFAPFHADTNPKLFEKIMAGRYTFLSPYWDKISDSAKDLIRNMLVVDPKQRFTSTQVLEHPWIRGNTATDEDIRGALTELKKTKEEENKVMTLTTGSSAARMALSSIE